MQQRTKFLIVDDDDLVYELITEQILTGGDFEFYQASSGEEAIQIAKENRPDLILLDLVMPGLTGYDVMVAIRQQGFSGQIIVSTKRGSEEKAIEAFRLGATDFITKPLRPPELVSVLERTLEAVRLRREKDNLVATIQKTNQILESRVKELTSLTNIGHLITRMRSPKELFDVVLTAMLDITHADYASILLLDLNTNDITLHAGKNLTLVMQENLGEVIKDQIAELALTSQQPVVAAGEGLQRFKVSREIRAVVYAPMIAHGKGLGVLTIGNYKKRTEFTDRHGDLLHTMADYVAIGLVNARLFHALDHSARDSQEAKRKSETQQLELRGALEPPLRELQERLAGIGQRTLPFELKAQIVELQKLATSIHQYVDDYTSNAQRTARGIHRISPPKS